MDFCLIESLSIASVDEGGPSNPYTLGDDDRYPLSILPGLYHDLIINTTTYHKVYNQSVSEEHRAQKGNYSFEKNS